MLTGPRFDGALSWEGSTSKPSTFPQGPDSGINAIIGKWPGDEGLGEDEERFIALIEEIS
jgi:hypothetical protein